MATNDVVVKIEVAGYIYSANGQAGCPTGIVIKTTYNNGN